MRRGRCSPCHKAIESASDTQVMMGQKLETVATKPGDLKSSPSAPAQPAIVSFRRGLRADERWHDLALDGNISAGLPRPSHSPRRTATAGTAVGGDATGTRCRLAQDGFHDCDSPINRMAQLCKSVNAPTVGLADFLVTTLDAAVRSKNHRNFEPVDCGAVIGCRPAGWLGRRQPAPTPGGPTRRADCGGPPGFLATVSNHAHLESGIVNFESLVGCGQRPR